jgi:ubiquinone/menaquinone biosynthesis C-methylase UbiE
MSTPWYARAFDAPYLEVYAHRDAEEAERATRCLLEPLGLAGKRVLDLACGAGRYARALARRDACMVGLDLSQELLRQAAQDGPATSLLGWVRGDMLRLPLRDASFDLVLSMFTSFGYMPRAEGDVRVLYEMRRVTRRGGRLLVDLFNAEQVRRGIVPESRRRAGPYEVTERRVIEADVVVKEIELRRGNEHHRYRERVRLWAAADLERALEQAGFQVQRRWGSYEGEPFDATHSTRLIVLAGDRAQGG